MTYTDHGKAYSDAHVREILGSVKTIAMVGASGNPTKPSYDVLRVLIDAGCDMIPVNPRPELSEILGRKVYPSVKSIERPVDMLDVFRPSGELAAIASEAAEIGARVFWAQLGIHNDEAARIAEGGGLKVVMDRCPKLELARLSRKTTHESRDSTVAPQSVESVTERLATTTEACTAPAASRSNHLPYEEA